MSNAAEASAVGHACASVKPWLHVQQEPTMSGVAFANPARRRIKVCRPRICACLGACTKWQDVGIFSVLTTLARVPAIGVRQAGQAGQRPHNSMRKSDTARQGANALAHGTVLLRFQIRGVKGTLPGSGQSLLVLHLVLQVKPVKA